MRKILIVGILLIGSIVGYSQDIHLSQWYTSDHLLSPAKVGDFEGDYRFIGNYRNQWKQIEPMSKAITTTILSFDKAFHYYSHEIDAGIMIAHDEFGGFGYSSDKILLTGGYAKEIDGHNLRGGIQTGIVFRKSDLSKQTFPSQWNYGSGVFDQSWDNMENNAYNNGSLSYVDLNLGVQWSKKFGDLVPKAGVALNHLSRPKDTYFATHVERLRVRKVIYAELEYYYTNKLIIQPKLLSMFTAKADDFIIGANVKYQLDHKMFPYVFGGVFYRNGFAANQDAFYPVVGCTYKDFDIGISYDMNISSLSEYVKRKGSFELSVIYTAPTSKPKYITIPCERY